MANPDGTSFVFSVRKRLVVNALVNYLNSETEEVGSLVLNWNALKDQIGEEAQQEALDEALEYFQDPLASYARDDEYLRNEIERVLSDIMDNKLPNPIATPGTTPESSSSSHSGDGRDETSEAESSTTRDEAGSETQTVQLEGDSDEDEDENLRGVVRDEEEEDADDEGED